MQMFISLRTCKGQPPLFAHLLYGLRAYGWDPRPQQTHVSQSLASRFGVDQHRTESSVQFPAHRMAQAGLLFLDSVDWDPVECVAVMDRLMASAVPAGCVVVEVHASGESCVSKAMGQRQSRHVHGATGLGSGEHRKRLQLIGSNPHADNRVKYEGTNSTVFLVVQSHA